MKCEIKKMINDVLKNRGKCSQIDTTIRKLITYDDERLRYSQVEVCEMNVTIMSLVVPSALKKNSEENY